MSDWSISLLSPYSHVILVACLQHGVLDPFPPLDQGTARHLGHCMDGGLALPAAAFRLSRRGGTRFGDRCDLQGDGAAAPAWHHDPGDARLALLRSAAAACAGGVPAGMVTCQAVVIDRNVRPTRLLFPLPSGF